MSWPKLARTARLLAAGGLAALTADAATAARMWVEPQEVAATDPVPRVDGRNGYDRENLTRPRFVEYSRARQVPLSNWIPWDPASGPRPGGGTAYLQLQAGSCAPGQNAGCSPQRPNRLFVGLKFPRRANTVDRRDYATIELFLQKRWPTSCPAANPADRWIRIQLVQNFAPGGTVSTIAAEELAYAADCGSWQPAAGTLVAHKVRIDPDPGFFFAEIELALDPALYAQESFRFGLKLTDPDYLSPAQWQLWESSGRVKAPVVLTIPNDYDVASNGQPTFGEPYQWQEIVIREPPAAEVSVSTYNVGLMQAVSNGGPGKPRDFARRIYRRDHLCLIEVMKESDRIELKNSLNELRRAEGLREYEMVEASNSLLGEGGPPNNVIFTSWIPTQETSVLFRSLPNPLAPGEECVGEDDSEAVGPFQFADGAKGVVWARVNRPVSDGAHGEMPSADEWFDLYCTHLQAPYDKETQFDAHNQNVRDCQVAILADVIEKTRARGGGLRRPALLLGDLNQVGPKSVGNNVDVAPRPFTADLNRWLSPGGEQPGSGGVADDATAENLGVARILADSYRSMRERLGNWTTIAADRDSPRNLKSYDLTADTGGEGTWLGGENFASTSKARSWGTPELPCDPVSPDLRRTPRVDYAMVIPPRLATPESVPEWTFRWRGPARAAVDRNAVTYTFAIPDPSLGLTPLPGCLSDHAQVSADLVFLSAADRAAFNPSEPHRLVYTVSRLVDVFGSDDTFGDDGKTDWYTNSFGIRFGGAMSTVAAGPGVTLAAEPGKVVTPNPAFWSLTSAHLEMPGVADGFDTFLTLQDEDDGGDDEYDADPSPALRAINLDIAPGPTPARWTVAIRNAGGPIATTAKPFQGTRAIYRIAGVGDVDVADVTHELWLCPIDDGGRCVDDK